MAKHRLGECDGPTCTLDGRRLCPFCSLTPTEIFVCHFIKKKIMCINADMIAGMTAGMIAGICPLQKKRAYARYHVRSIKFPCLIFPLDRLIRFPQQWHQCPPLTAAVPPNAMFPYIPPLQRPPDLLHGNTNFCKWLILLSIELHTNRNHPAEFYFQKWTGPFGCRRHHVNPDSTWPVSECTAMWKFMQEKGWEDILVDLQDLPHHGELVNLPRPDGTFSILTPFQILGFAWRAHHALFSVLNTPNDILPATVHHLSMQLRRFLSALGKPLTAWAHIWTNHLAQFVEAHRGLMNFSCHSLEAHHKRVKQDFRLSFKSTKRYRNSNGHCDVLHADNVSLSLLFCGISLHTSLQIPIGVKKGKRRWSKKFIVKHIDDILVKF